MAGVMRAPSMLFSTPTLYGADTKPFSVAQNVDALIIQDISMNSFLVSEKEIFAIVIEFCDWKFQFEILLHFESDTYPFDFYILTVTK